MYKSLSLWEKALRWALVPMNLVFLLFLVIRVSCINTSDILSYFGYCLRMSYMVCALFSGFQYWCVNYENYLLWIVLHCLLWNHDISLRLNFSYFHGYPSIYDKWCICPPNQVVHLFQNWIQSILCEAVVIDNLIKLT